MQHHVPVSGREAFTAASELMASFGEHAASEAALRARRSRTLGNVVHFCRWRDIERAIEILRDERVTGLLH